MREKSDKVAKVFDLSKNPEVLNQLAKEQAVEPRTTSLRHARMAIVEGSHGTYCLLSDGSFYRRSVDQGVTIGLRRYMDERPGHCTFEAADVVMATFTAEEIKAALTGEEVLLHDFVTQSDGADARLKLFEERIK